MSRAKKIIIAGWSLIGLGVVMFLAGGVYFTGTSTPPPLWDYIGQVSFCGWWAAGLGGIILLIAGYRASTKGGAGGG